MRHWHELFAHNMKEFDDNIENFYQKKKTDDDNSFEICLLTAHY